MGLTEFLFHFGILRSCTRAQLLPQVPRAPTPATQRRRRGLSSRQLTRAGPSTWGRGSGSRSGPPERGPVCAQKMERSDWSGRDSLEEVCPRGCRWTAHYRYRRRRPPARPPCAPFPVPPSPPPVAARWRGRPCWPRPWTPSSRAAAGARADRGRSVPTRDPALARSWRGGRPSGVSPRGWGRRAARVRAAEPRHPRFARRPGATRGPQQGGDLRTLGRRASSFTLGKPCGTPGPAWIAHDFVPHEADPQDTEIVVHVGARGRFCTGSREPGAHPAFIHPAPGRAARVVAHTHPSP